MLHNAQVLSGFAGRCGCHTALSGISLFGGKFNFAFPGVDFVGVPLLDVDDPLAFWSFLSKSGCNRNFILQT